MKVACDPRQITVSQVNLSKALGVTANRVSQLIGEGIVIKDDADKKGGVMLLQSVRNYDAMKRSGRSAVQADDDEEIDINLERAKREAAERKIAELKLAKMEGRVYDARTVELVQTEMLSNLRTQLLAMPSKLAPMIEGKTKSEIYETLTSEITEKLEELSEYCPEQYLSEEVADEDGD